MIAYSKALAQLVQKQNDEWKIINQRFLDQLASIGRQHAKARLFTNAKNTYEYWELKEKYHLPLGRAARAALANPEPWHLRGTR